MLAIPRDLIEAARIDGAGNFRVFMKIVLPLSKPLIAVMFFLALLGSWNDFVSPLIAVKQNELFALPVGLLYLQGQFGSDYGGTMAFALKSASPVFLVDGLAGDPEGRSDHLPAETEVTSPPNQRRLVEVDLRAKRAHSAK